MREEEKRAIEDLKEEIEYYKRKYFNSKDDEEYNDKILYSIRLSVKDSEVLVNLIEKLEKEMEARKSERETFFKWLSFTCKELGISEDTPIIDMLQEIKDNYIPKDKIREKLEKIEKEKIQYYDAGQPLIYMLLKNQLKSLIEEKQ